MRRLHAFWPLMLCVATLVAGCNSDGGLTREADRALRAGNYEEAAAKYQAAARKAGRTSTAQQLSLQSADIMNLYLKRYEPAANEYIRAIQLAPKSETAFGARAKLGELLVTRLGDPRRGIEEYNRALSAFPNARGRDKVQMQVAKVYFELDQLNQARIELQSLARDYPKSTLAPKALYIVADSFYVEDMNSDAERVYRKILADYPGSEEAPLAQFGLARAMEEAGELEKALASYEQVREKHPNPAVVELRIARIKDRL